MHVLWAASHILFMSPLTIIFGVAALAGIAGSMGGE